MPMRSTTLTAIAAALIAAPLAGAAVSPARAHQMVALDELGDLIRFNSKNPRATERVTIKGTSARIVGIDVRPRDRMLYGLAADGTLYRIASGNGQATPLWRTPLANVADPAIVDFNPVIDRLRVVTADGRSYHVNVDSGAVEDDAPLFTPVPSARFPVSGGGYTHSWPGRVAESTGFYQIDNVNLRLIGREPAVDGTMVFTSTLASPIAMTGGTKDLRGGDIVTSPTGQSEAFVVKGSRLYKIAVPGGQISLLGQVGEIEGLDLVDVAVTEVE
jgi:hypothetical protein